MSFEKLFTFRKKQGAYSLSGNKKTVRLAVIGILILIVGLAHWITPVAHHHFHIFHVIFRKLFVLPIVLSAIWFETTGAIVAASVISIIYIPHVFLQWSGQPAENVNQIGEIATIWVIAILSGIFSRMEKGALREVARTRHVYDGASCLRESAGATGGEDFILVFSPRRTPRPQG